MSRKRVSDGFWTSNDIFVEPNKKRKTLLTDEERNLHSTLAWQWAIIMKDGLLQTVKNELLAEYSPTGDYHLLVPPNVNNDLKYFLNQKSMQADQRYVNIQEQITSALIGIGKIIASALMSNDSRLIDADILIDIAMLLGNIHHDISLQRRSTVISAFDLEGITDLSQVNETLFGEKLMKIIKSAKVLPDCQAEDDKSKIPLIESVANGSNNPEKTVNDSAENRLENGEKNVDDSAANGSKHPEQIVNDSTANRSENPEKIVDDAAASRSENPAKNVDDPAANRLKNPHKNVNGADENLQEKLKSDAEEPAKTPSPENKDSDANKTIETEINKKSQESSERVERSEENAIGAKSLEAESAKNARLGENDSREKTVIGESSTEGAKSTDKNVDFPEKIVVPTSADSTPTSAKAANAGEEDLPATRTDGAGSQKNGKDLSSVAKCPDEMINPAETNLEDKSRSNVDAHKNTETADIIFLEVKNASLRVIEEMDVALKKKLEALQMDDAYVKPEKKAARGALPQGDFPGFQKAYKLRLLYQGYCEAAAETMSWALAKSTMAQYQPPIRLWWKFCKDHNYNVFEGSEQNVTEFFVEYDDLISSSAALARWRSALGRFTLNDISKSQAISDYVNGYKSLKGEKVEKK